MAYQYVGHRESSTTAIFRYAVHDSAREVLESIRAENVRDRSPEHSINRDGYDSRCGYCYLGAGHTREYHAAAILRPGL